MQWPVVYSFLNAESEYILKWVLASAPRPPQALPANTLAFLNPFGQGIEPLHMNGKWSMTPLLQCCHKDSDVAAGKQ